MATIITSSTTISQGPFVFLADLTAGNITITIPLMDYDYQFYTIVRIDNTANVLNIVLDSTTLNTLETNFDLGGYKNIGLMSLNGVWYPITGATNSIR